MAKRQEWGCYESDWNNNENVSGEYYGVYYFGTRKAAFDQYMKDAADRFCDMRESSSDEAEALQNAIGDRRVLMSLVRRNDPDAYIRASMSDRAEDPLRYRLHHYIDTGLVRSKDRAEAELRRLYREMYLAWARKHVRLEGRIPLEGAVVEDITERANAELKRLVEKGLWKGPNGLERNPPPPAPPSSQRFSPSRPSREELERVERSGVRTPK